MERSESRVDWTSLYRLGAVAALLMVLLIPIESAIFIIWPPPSTAADYFALFQHNWLLGLLSLDLMYLLVNTLMIPIYLALAVALRRTSPAWIVTALTLSLVGVAAFYAGKPAFEMLGLSTHYARATTDAQRAMFLAAGEAMLAIHNGTAFDAYYILNAVALLIFSAVMLRSTIFSKANAYLGFLSGGLMLVPSTAGTIGVAFALGSLVPWTIWLVLFARTLFQLREMHDT